MGEDKFKGDLKMPKKIVVNFKTGEVKTYGKIEDRHINLAIAKLRFRETQPCKRDYLCRKVKKFFKCVKYALSKEENRYTTLTVQRPILIESETR